MVLKSTALEDVDLYRLVENVIHLTKRSTIIDDLLRERILSCMNAFNNLMDCDMDLAHELARDLTIIRALIKKESEDLDRKFSIFERKLRKIANAILPKDTDEILGEDTEAQLTTTIFQDNDVRIIDTVNRKSALNKMEEARELVGVCKEIIKLANIPSLPIILKSNVLQRMNEMLCLLKLDGGLAIKLKRDILEVRNALQKGDETSEPNLENKMKILKLKLEKCNEELDKREETCLVIKIPGRHNISSNCERIKAGKFCKERNRVKLMFSQEMTTTFNNSTIYFVKKIRRAGIKTIIRKLGKFSPKKRKERKDKEIQDVKKKQAKLKKSKKKKGKDEKSKKCSKQQITKSADFQKIIKKALSKDVPTKKKKETAMIIKNE